MSFKKLFSAVIILLIGMVFTEAAWAEQAGVNQTVIDAIYQTSEKEVAASVAEHCPLVTPQVSRRQPPACRQTKIKQLSTATVIATAFTRRVVIR